MGRVDHLLLHISSRPTYAKMKFAVALLVVVGMAAFAAATPHPFGVSKGVSGNLGQGGCAYATYCPSTSSCCSMPEGYTDFCCGESDPVCCGPAYGAKIGFCCPEGTRCGTQQNCLS